MKKLLLLFIISPFLCFSQIQIGQDIDGEANFDQSGFSLAMSSNGSIVAISSLFNDGINGINSGHVRVFENINSEWLQTGQDIDGEAADDKSGYSISMSSDGSIVAISAPSNNGVNGIFSGHVRVYQNINEVWTQVGQDIDGDEMAGNFGRSIDLSSDGSILAISSNANPNDNGRGYVKVYENINGTWTQIGQSILGEAEFDNSGISIDLSSDGSIIAIGAPYNNGVNGFKSGHVRVFQNLNGIWTQIGEDIDGEFINDESGQSISMSLDGSIIAIGAPKNTTNAIAALSKGHVRVYENINGTWTQIGQDIDGENFGDNLGKSLSLSSDGEVLGITTANNNSSNPYYVTLYKRISGIWTMIGNNINGEFIGDGFGNSLELNSDGTILSISAPFDNFGKVRIYSVASELAVLEVVEDITGNINGVNITAEQLNSINGVSGAIEGVNYTTALGNGSFVDENNPTALEIQAIIDQVNSTLSITDSDSLEFELYPNPTKNQFTVQFENGIELNVNIYNNLGQLVLNSKETTINTSKLAAGLYIVEIKTAKGNGSKKLIIE